ncbi:MAG: OB-fold nucleic acid binding domain-containing protein, partial [Geobacter sp.]
MEELSELLLQRRRKVNALWTAGINPYPNDFKPAHTAADVVEQYGSVEQIDAPDVEFVLAGRIIARRSFGKAAFIQIQDRSGRIQVYVRKDDLSEEAFAQFESFDIGDIIGVAGFPFRTQKGELS